MTFRWAQGAKSYQFGFIDNHVLCIRSGPSLRFHNLSDNQLQFIRLPTNQVTSLLIHPLEPYAAVAEVQCVNPKVYIYKYPELTLTLLKGSGKLEIRQAIFSHASYLATASGTPDFILSLWNFKNNTLLCQSSLNGTSLITFSFCPTNWRILTGTDEKCLHIWQIELCKEITLVHCRSITLPYQGAPVGLNEREQDVKPVQRKAQEMTRFDPILPENATSGVTEEKQAEFADYTDQTDHVLCVSQTWSNNELLFLGCRYGQLLLVDPISGVIRILLNPLSYQAYSIASESMDSRFDGSTSITIHHRTSYSKSKENQMGFANHCESLTVPFGCFTHLIFTKHGIFCAGKDGILRLITFVTNKQAKAPLENGNGQMSLMNPMLQRLQFNSCHKVFNFSNPFGPNDSICPLGITGLAVSASYGRLAISSLTGQFAILDLIGDNWDKEQSLTASQKFLTSGDSFVGLGLLGPEKKHYVATARRNGLLNIWAVDSGELIGSLAVGERCFSVAVSPLYPLVALGLKSGVLLMLDCTKPDTIRVVRSLKLFKNPITHIRFDHTGELLLTVADNEKAIIVSGYATTQFDPIGHIGISGKVVDLSLLRTSDASRAFAVIATGECYDAGATNIWFFELKFSTLNEQAQAFTDSCRGLREDVIRLMQLQLDTPAVTACLWPTWESDPGAAPLLFTTDLEAKRIFVYALPKEFIRRPTAFGYKTNRHVIDAQNALPGNGGPTSELSLQATSQQNGHHNQQPLRRNSKRARNGPGVNMRLTPSTTAATGIAEPIDSGAEDPCQSQQGLTRLNALTTCKILRGIRPVRFVRVDCKDFLKVYYGDGSFELIYITKQETSIKCSVSLHEFDRVGIMGAEFCGNLRNLLSCGYDGLLSLTELQLEKEDILEVDGYLATLKRNSSEQTEALMRLPTFIPKEPQVIAERSSLHLGRSGHNSSPPLLFRSSTVMALADKTIDLSDSIEYSDEPLETGPILSDPHRPTWIEECELKAQETENQMYMEVQQKLKSDLAEISQIINTMAEENEQLTPMQRISRQEFELDTDEQAAIIEETEQALKQVRYDIEMEDLANQFTWSVIKQHCWDEMQVKGRSLRAFNSKLEVCNFPLKPRGQLELSRLTAVQTRRRLQLQLEEEIERIARTSHQKAASETVQHEEAEDEEEKVADVNRVMNGSIALEYGGTSEYMFGQMELYTREEKLYQTVLIQDNIFRIKETFNKMFDDVYEKKEGGLGRIRSRLARVRKILIDLQQPGSAVVIFDPQFSPEEQPEQLLTVHDAEITVEKYLSPAQLAELEAKRLAEEERKRREKLDNWRERGLEEMMGGVLEIRKEDELKKDVPKPAFLLTGKPLGHWTEDDKRLYAEYERKVKELNEEREKYRKFLEADVKKMYAQIDEEKAKFDEQLLSLFQHWISVQKAVLQEELKVWRLKWMLLIEEELFVQEYELIHLLSRSESEIDEMNKTLEESKKALEDEQQLYEIQCAEDRLLEKNFRKDFSDVHGPLYEYIAKAFRRRPRRVAAPGSATHTTETDLYDRVRSYDQPGSTIFNPYVEKPSAKRVPTDHKAIIEEHIKELDNDPAHETQPGMDHSVWERLCKYRRRKIDKEMQIKATALQLAEMTSFVQKREVDLKRLENKRNTINADLSNLLKDCHRNQTDLELQLLIKQGQVEVEVPEDFMVRDFSDALLIDRERVEALNRHIITLGESKVAHMIRNKEFKKRFYHLEWELRQMLMQYEDLQAKQADIRKFKITREIQKYLECSDYDAVINSQILTIEQTINLQRQAHEKAMEKKRKRLRRYEVHQAQKLASENKIADIQLQELNVSLHETKFIHEQSRCMELQGKTGVSRSKMLLQQQRLMQLARDQARELRVLRAEVERIKREVCSSSPRF